eukprot:1153702-Pelagomonas_calceolata.AAC.9
MGQLSSGQVRMSVNAWGKGGPPSPSIRFHSECSMKICFHCKCADLIFNRLSPLKMKLWPPTPPHRAVAGVHSRGAGGKQRAKQRRGGHSGASMQEGSVACSTSPVLRSTLDFWAGLKFLNLPCTVSTYYPGPGV